MTSNQRTQQIKNQYSDESSEIEISIIELIVELQREELILLLDSTNLVYQHKPTNTLTYEIK